MSKQEEYQKLVLVDRVTYINNQLAEGNSLNAIAKDLGIRESSVRQQFNKAGYKREGKQFILAVGKEPVTEKIPQVVETGKALQEEEPAPRSAYVNANDFTALVARVEALEQTLKESLDQVARAAESRHILIDLPKETQEARSTFRINGEVFKQWQELQKKCPGVTAKDLMSQALWEYINRHDMK